MKIEISLLRPRVRGYASTTPLWRPYLPFATRNFCEHSGADTGFFPEGVKVLWTWLVDVIFLNFLEGAQWKCYHIRDVTPISPLNPPHPCVRQRPLYYSPNSVRLLSAKECLTYSLPSHFHLFLRFLQEKRKVWDRNRKLQLHESIRRWNEDVSFRVCWSIYLHILSWRMINVFFFLKIECDFDIESL